MTEVLIGAVIVGLCVIGTVALIGSLRLWWWRRRRYKAVERAIRLSQWRSR
jgi:hypothetical protein